MVRQKGRIIDADAIQAAAEEKLGRVYRPKDKKKKTSRPFLFTKIFN